MSFWLLIDGNNVVCRDVFGGGVKKAAGSFEKRLDAIMQAWNPNCVIVCWDSDGPTFRHQLFGEYKAGREPVDGIDYAIRQVKGLCSTMSIGQFQFDGFEADDIIATIVDQVFLETRVVIYSTDKDLHQLLVEGRVSQLKRCSKSFDRLDCEWVTASSLKEKYGVTPKQWVEWKMIAGDASDGIGGVYRVGQKGATQLLSTCGTLDKFYANPAKANFGKARTETMLKSRSGLDLYRQLCELRRDVPLDSMWREGV